MTRAIRTSAIALAVATGWAIPAHAQDAGTVQQELSAMRAQMDQMARRIDMLEAQLAEARSRTAATPAAPAASAAAVAVPTSPVPLPGVAAPTATARPATEITWDGAPKLAAAGGWSFKPRGRLQMDIAGVDAPAGMTAAQRQELGVATEFRRAYLGFDGTMPGGFGYRLEVDLANTDVQLTDLFLTYKASPFVTFTVGQHKPFWSMEESTSDLMTSFMERAAFNNAFGFERRVGASATYLDKRWLVQAGVFADSAADLTSDRNNSYSLDARAVFMPEIAGGKGHIGGSVHYRDFNDVAATTRYRVRPFVHTTDLRLVDTKDISATGERSFGAELAWVRGRFHATAEGHWITALRPGMGDPTFNGGYAEVGYLLTDDVTAYRNSAYDRIRPKTPLGGGGFGAVQVNARYDWLDLNDKGIVGGRQRAAEASLLWIPTDYVRFILNYGHVWIDDAAVPAAGSRSYDIDSLGVRAQFDF